MGSCLERVGFVFAVAAAVLVLGLRFLSERARRGRMFSKMESLSVFRFPAYRRYFVMRSLFSGSRHMLAVAIGWQVYEIARQTRSIEESAVLLGFIGLAQFLPILILFLIAGQAADRVNRKSILVACNLVKIVAVVLLIIASRLSDDAALGLMFGVAVIMGIVNSFAPSASTSLYPLLVPRKDLPNAVSWNLIGYQGAAIFGPALAGGLFLISINAVYVAAILMLLVSTAAIATTQIPKHNVRNDVKAIALIREGLGYIASKPTILGAILLDFIVVFFSGATALLPIFARDILHIGPEGLGVLRAAPAFGGIIVGYALAAYPLVRRVGFWLLASVAITGVSMFVFGSSGAVWLSFCALGVYGGADMMSVYIRQSLIQLTTPEHLRGRVAAVSFLFVAGSNELGEFESGIAARFLGPVGAVFLGGSAAILVSTLWIKVFPTLARADRMEPSET